MGLARHQTDSMDPYKTDPDEFCQSQSLHFRIRDLPEIWLAISCGCDCDCSMKTGQKCCKWSERSSKMGLTTCSG